MRKIAYDWTGQRTRRRRALRFMTVAMLLLLVIGIPFLMLR